MSDVYKQETGGTHYLGLAITPVEYAMRNRLDFSEGNIVKFVSRHRLKGKDEDIKKAIDYCKIILHYEYGYTEEQLSKL